LECFDSFGKGRLLLARTKESGLGLSSLLVGLKDTSEVSWVSGGFGDKGKEFSTFIILLLYFFYFSKLILVPRASKAVMASEAAFVAEGRGIGRIGDGVNNQYT
jgi:hypothetical protein